MKPVKSTPGRAVTLAIVLALLTGCKMINPAGGLHAHHTGRSLQDVDPRRVINLRDATSLEQLLPRLAKARVVFVGETHDQYHHHLNQLDVIKGMYAQNPDLAIGVEFFQQPFQPVLDRYIAGEISETEMLEQTGYFQRWKFDYRLYAPILRYAREKGIPVIALNLPEEITHKVGKEGIEGLTEEERRQIPPEIDRTMPGYEARLKKIFHMHPNADERNFDHFLEVQLLWDEGMAQRAADYLNEHPTTRMVILAGVGHIAYGIGIPARLTRRVPVETVLLLNNGSLPIDPEMGDYLLVSEEKKLPEPARLGLYLDATAEGMKVASLAEESAAGEAGVRKGDLITAIGERRVRGMSDVRLALWGRQSGDQVVVEVQRAAAGGRPEGKRFTVQLR